MAKTFPVKIDRAIQRDKEVARLARKANLPRYMWDTLDGLTALARFMDEIVKEHSSSATPER